MSPAKEKDIKDKLTEVWKKEMIRVQNIPNGWIEKRLTLGKGIAKSNGTESIQKMLDVLEDFGIDIQLLKEMKADYDQIQEIYNAVIDYRISLKILRELKDHMTLFRDFKEWRS